MLHLRLYFSLRAARQAGTSLNILPDASKSWYTDCSSVLTSYTDISNSVRRGFAVAHPLPTAPQVWQNRDRADQPSVNYDPMSPHPATLSSGPLTVSYPSKDLTDYLRDREVLIYSLLNQPHGVTLLSGSVFNVPVRVDILHRCVRYLRALWQQGTHSSKSRADARGGGKKPWPQKGSGRARHGSIRSPLWKGGGAAWGPKPRSHAHKLPATVRQMGMKCALSAKLNEGRLVVVDSLSPSEETPKTRDMENRVAGLISRMHAKTALLVDSEDRGCDGGVKLRRSAGNLKGVEIMSVGEVTVYHLLKSHALIISRPALEILGKTLSGPAHPRRKPLRAAWWQQQQMAYKAATEELLAASKGQSK